MIDMHSHIIFNVDDGSESIEESIEIISTAKKQGVKAMFATPHFIQGSMTVDSKEVHEKIEILKKELVLHNIDMPIYCGHEIFLDYESIDRLKERESLSLNNTRYILIEMSLQSELNNLDEIIYDIVLKGYIPIIAHPERYNYVQENEELVERWIKLGALLQLNLTSMYGQYGKKAKQTAITMLNRHMYHFVGTDVHSSNSLNLSIAKSLKKVLNIVGDEFYYDIILNNPQKVVENKTVLPFEINKRRFSLKNIF